MDEILNLLDEAIISQFSELTSVESCSDEQTKGVKNLETLMSIKMNMYKQTVDYTNEKEKLKIEKDKNEFDRSLQKKNMIINSVEKGLKLVLEGTSIVLPLVFYHAWMNRGFEFEEKGIISSMTFRELIKNFKPKLK